MERQVINLLNYMDIAERVSQISNCKRKKTGAVIVPTTGCVYGFNRIPKWFMCEKCPREGKKRGDWTEKECPVVHAEVDAIGWAVVANIDIKGATMYSTYKPCVPCAEAIDKAGIIKVIYRDDYPGNEVEEYFKENGVELVKHERKSVKD